MKRKSTHLDDLESDDCGYNTKRHARQLVTIARQAKAATRLSLLARLSSQRDLRSQEAEAAASRAQENPYKHKLYARKLDESVDAFIARLPPQTTLATASEPWIWIADFAHPRTRVELQDDANGVLERGRTILRNLLGDFAKIDAERLSAGQKSMRKTKVRKNAEMAIKDLAVCMHETSGKWMLFIPPAEINAIWTIIAHAVGASQLGPVAKVAPRDPSGGNGAARLICVYTKDFTDKGDVVRVLMVLRDLGIVGPRMRTIYYKADVYTHLNLYSGNEYGISPSLYTSTALLLT